MDQPMTIGVCGSGSADPALSELAERVGTTIAKAEMRLICGGLGGTMAAACKGAREHGGMTIGLLPGQDPLEANEWVQVPIATGLREGRNLLIVLNADGVVALPGGSGTLSEIALALKTQTPVLDLGDWDIDGMRRYAGDVEEVVGRFITEVGGILT